MAPDLEDDTPPGGPGGGALWFNTINPSQIVRITNTGVTQFPVPPSPTRPVFGPDGNIWFGLYDVTLGVGRLNPATGAVTTFPMPFAAGQMTNGPDGNLWFLSSPGNISRITPTGSVFEFPLPAGVAPFSLTTGSDGNLWFTERQMGMNRVGRMTLAGLVTEFTVPLANLMPWAITAGPDGNLWFTEFFTGTPCILNIAP